MQEGIDAVKHMTQLATAAQCAAVRCGLSAACWGGVLGSKWTVAALSLLASAPSWFCAAQGAAAASPGSAQVGRAGQAACPGRQYGGPARGWPASSRGAQGRLHSALSSHGTRAHGPSLCRPWTASAGWSRARAPPRSRCSWPSAWSSGTSRRRPPWRCASRCSAQQYHAPAPSLAVMLGARDPHGMATDQCRCKAASWWGPQ